MKENSFAGVLAECCGDFVIASSSQVPVCFVKKTACKQHPFTVQDEVQIFPSVLPYYGG